MNEQQIQNLLKLYLTDALHLKLTEEQLKAINNPDSFRQALLFINKNYDDRLPLASIGSMNTTTAALYTKERQRLFDILNKSLEFNKNTLTFGSFISKKVNAEWIEQERKEDLSILTLHANPRNQPINEKFLAGCLHGKEWLNEVDLRRLLDLTGLRQQVTVTRLNVDDLGLAIHFARLQQINTTTPYTINLILNKGSTGDIFSQGSHWFEAQITITPGIPPVVQVEMEDSLLLSKEEEERVKNIVTQAIRYRDWVGTEPRVEFKALPDAIIQPITIKSGGQLDGWSCGYRALKKIVSRFNVASHKQEQRELVQRIVEASDNTALRNTLYHALLGSLTVPETLLQTGAIHLPDEALGSHADKKATALDKSFLSDYLNVVGKTDASSTPEERNPKIAKEKNQLEKDIETAFLKIKSKLTPKITEEKLEEKTPSSSVSLLKTLHVDLINDKLLEDKEEEKGSNKKLKATLLALIKFINENQITKLKLDLGAHSEEVTKLADVFAELAYVNDIECDSKDPALLKTFATTTARNQLIQFLEIDIDPEKNIWHQLYQTRLSDLELYGDSTVLKGELTIFSLAPRLSVQKKGVPLADRINQCINKAGAATFLYEQLNFLHTHKKFIERHPEQFPYDTFNLTDIMPINDLKCDHHSEMPLQLLTIMADHLEKKQFFPFKALKIDISSLSTVGFSQFKRLVAALEHYPHVDQIMLCLGETKELNAQQFRELNQIFKETSLTLLLTLVNVSPKVKKPTLADDQILARYELLNSIAINRRNKNIKKHTAAMATSTALSSAVASEEKIETLPLPSKRTTKRSCKLKSFNVQQALHFEIQVDKQHQHQRQTELHKEKQQETQITAQEQNDIVSNIGFGKKTKLYRPFTDAADLEKDQQIFGVLIRVIPLQCPALENSPIVNDPDIQLFWHHVLGSGNLEHSITALTPAAMAQITAAPAYFFGGFNLDNLPIGFYVQQHGDELVLCYSGTKYIENKNYSPLTPSLKLPVYRDRWMGNLCQFDEKLAAENDEKIFTFDGLVRAEDCSALIRGLTLQKFFGFIQWVNPSLANVIKKEHAWCLDPLNTTDIFSAEEEIFALIDLAYNMGCEGVKRFLDTLHVLYEKDKTFYRHFRQYFICFKGYKSVLSLMSEKNLSIIAKLSTLTETQKIWWEKIVELQAKHIGRLDLEQLFEGFTYFLSKFPSHVILPTTCPLNSENPLVELDRLLFILGASGKTLANQLEHLEGLDLSQDGAWYAARWDHFHHFHPKMALTNSTLSTKPADWKEKNYQVDYTKLRSLTTQTDFHFAEIAFHRYVGRAQHISSQYENYVKLTETLRDAKEIPLSTKLRLLPLLAVATTGARGSCEIDSTKLMAYLHQHAGDSKLNDTLDYIAEKLNSLSEKPNLNELTGLIKLAHGSQHPKTTLTLLMDEPISEKILQSWHTAQMNPLPMSADSFMELFKLCKIAKPTALPTWTQIAVRLRGDFTREQLVLFNAFLARPHDERFETLLGILTSLDLAKTYPLSLPTFEEIMQLLATWELEPAFDSKAASIFLGRQLPDCIFNRAEETILDLDLDTHFFECVALFNRKLQEYGVAPWDIEKLKGEEGIAYLEQQYAELMENVIPNIAYQKVIGKSKTVTKTDAKETKPTSFEKVITKPKEETKPTSIFERMKQAAEAAQNKIKETAEAAQKMAVSVFADKARKEVKKQMSSTIESFLMRTLNAQITTLPKLALYKKNYYPLQPKITGEQKTLKQELLQFQQFTRPLEKLFSVLVNLRKIWGTGFDIDFLLNSSHVASYAPAELERILTAIAELQLNFIPTALFAGIFPEKGALPPGTNTNELSIQIADIIKIKGLSLREKADIIQAMQKNAARPDFVSALVDGVRYVKDCYPAVQHHFLKIGLHALANQDNPKLHLITKTINLLKMYAPPREKDHHDDALVLLFERLANQSDDYEHILAALDNVHPHDKKNFLTMVALGFLKQDYHPQDNESRQQVKQGVHTLVEFSKHQRLVFLNLANLFGKIPYPRLQRVKALLTHPEMMKTYEFDPAGLRSDSEKLANQFNIDTIHERIDTLLDLGRDIKRGNPRPLFLTERQQLHTGIGYITAVGKDFPLVIPEDKDNQFKACQKPVKDLTGNEIRALVQHYRRVISESKASPDDLWIAKLEFAALIREALYRVEGKFAYDTQMLSLLNLMLQGGNVFSEIRTGEGKSLITAFFALFKWAEGGAVDVCSSNMTLAARDLSERKDLFDYLGVKTALISSVSPHANYQQDGINYSDISELSLFQEQCLLNNEPLPQKAALVVDEVDFTVLDNTTQFRFATSLESGFDPHYNPYEKLYPFILQFVQNDALFLHKDCSTDEDILNLRQFINGHPDISKQIKSMFMEIPLVTLDRWLTSAYTATKLRLNEDYVIREGTIIKGEEELKVLHARVKIHSRENSESRFSDGVHQFLHTLLNMRLKTDPHFMADKKQLTFPIEPEKTYLASRSSKNTLDYYLRGNPPRGNVIGLSGTIGTFQDRQELRKNYGAKFYRIPPNQRLRRTEFPARVAKRAGWLTKESQQTAHFRTIFENMMEAKQKGQSILIICETVEMTETLHKYFKEQWQRLNLSTENLQLHNGEQLDQKEQDVINKAGRPGIVTISTPMFGRGTDIKLQDKNAAGLHVIATYISEEREYWQNIGRGARNGEKGSSALILSENEFTSRGKKIPKKPHKLQRTIENIRLSIAAEKDKDRYERQLFSDIKDQFFAQYVELCGVVKAGVLADFSHLKANPAVHWEDISYKSFKRWEMFLRQIDEKWNELLTEMRNQLATSVESVSETILLKKQVASLTAFANKEWKKTHKEMLTEATSLLNKGYQEARKKYMDFQALHPLDVKLSLVGGQLPVKLETTWCTPPRENPTPLNHVVRNAGDELQGLPVNPRPLNFSLTPRQLNPTRANHAMSSYLDLANGKTSQAYEITLNQKREILLTTCEQIMSRFAPGRRVMIDSEEGVAQVKEFAKNLLNKHYKVSKTGQITHVAHITAFRQLSDAIAKSSQPDYKNMLFTTLEEHKNEILEQQLRNKKLGNYLLNMHTLKQNLLSSMPDVTMPINENSQVKAWQQTYDMAIQRMSRYQGAIHRLWRSADRETVTNDFLNELEEIHTRPHSPQQKFQELLKLIEKLSNRMMSTDLEIDRNRTFRSHRNAEGSRLQAIMADVRTFAHAMYAMHRPIDKTKVSFVDELKYVQDSLVQLSERHAIANLNQLHLSPHLFSSFAMDGLTTQQSDLEKYKQLVIREEQLNNTHAAIVQCKKLNSSQKAFLHSLKDTINRVTLLRQRFENQLSMHQELDKRDITLRNQLQENLTNLFLQKRSLLGLSLTERYQAIADIKMNPADTKKVYSALFEIERLITLAHANTNKFKYTNVSFENNNLQVKATFESGEKAYQLEFGISHLGQAAMVCHWPEVKLQAEPSLVATPRTLH